MTPNPPHTAPARPSGMQRRSAPAVRLLFALAACAVLALGTAFAARVGAVGARALDSSWRERVRAASLCRDRLAAVASAKDLWLVNHPPPVPENVTWDDLLLPRGFLARIPRCPAGGDYALNPVGELPTCPLGDQGTASDADNHALPQPRRGESK